MNRPFVMSPLIVLEGSPHVKPATAKQLASRLKLSAVGHAAVAAAVVQQRDLAGLDAHVEHPAEDEHVVASLDDTLDIAIDECHGPN